ncbi:MAG: hypothetical protein FWF15_07285 [Oscillospiraceae bacterium]|nr:hypothetical protein [Oscillospiraceae bacterium]
MAVYKDMVMCDLRHLNDLEAIKQIEEISDIVTLILPSDAEPEIMGAFASVPKNDIVQVLYLGKNVKLITINGISNITKNSYGDEEIYLIINGIAVIASIAENNKITFNINGIAIINKKQVTSGVKLGSINGITIETEFDDYKFYSNAITVDKDMLEYIAPYTAIIAGNKIDISADVTIEMLKEKSIKFIAGNKIICRKEIMGYIKATATVGNKVITKEEYELENQEDFEDDDE